MPTLRSRSTVVEHRGNSVPSVCTETSCALEIFPVDLVVFTVGCAKLRSVRFLQLHHNYEPLRDLGELHNPAGGRVWGVCGSRDAPCPPTTPSLVSLSWTLRGARAGVGVIGHPSHARQRSVGTPSPSLPPWSRGGALPRRRGWRRRRRRPPCVTWLLPRRYVRTIPHGRGVRVKSHGEGAGGGLSALSA